MFCFKEALFMNHPVYTSMQKEYLLVLLVWKRRTLLCDKQTNVILIKQVEPPQILE